MRGPFERVDQSVILEALGAHFGLSITELTYVPEGGGAYHWLAVDDGARPWFVTCDDLDIKPWLGADRESVFTNLSVSYRTAMGLRADGLDFVVAPAAARSGAAAVRLDDRHCVSVFEHVEGTPGRWGDVLDPATTTDIVAILGRLHRSEPPVHGLGRRGVEVHGRRELEEALAHLGRPWTGGPLAEPARQELEAHAAYVVEGLADLDRFAARDGGSDEPVVTHGEPHPGNLIHTARSLRLVDWDTVAMGRPERDLWMLTRTDPLAAGAYQELTGVALDPEALSAYELVWALTDAASFVAQLRAAERPGVDDHRALVALRRIFEGSDPAPYRRVGERSPD